MPHAPRVVKGMQDLATCLTQAGEEMALLADRARVVADRVSSGQRLVDVIGDPPQPLVIARLARLLDDLADAGAEVRRAEAAQLHAEGLSQGRIAKVFGVTRQRVSALLAPPPPPGARAAKRPRPQT